MTFWGWTSYCLNIAECHDKGINIRVEGSEIVLSAPKGTLTPDLISRVKEEKPALIVSLGAASNTDINVRSVDMLARELLQKRPEELQKSAGDRWRWIAEDPDNLIAFASYEARRQIEGSGDIPKEYDGTTHCRKCGPVPFYRGFDRRVFNMCPWCFTGGPPPLPGIKE